MLKEDFKNFIDEPKFFEFVNCEFEKTANHATIEELSEFAFGSIEDAIEAFFEKKD